MTQTEIDRLKLRVALQSAPTPVPASPSVDWMLKYMDWFYRSRTEAMLETDNQVRAAGIEGK